MNDHCAWCQRRFVDTDEKQVVDKLYFHANKANGSQSCVEAYRLYCRHIKEQG